MGVQERKEREKAEMRQSIIAAATRLFLEKGYESVSIRNIAAAIEYSPGTIYLYFKDKDDILYAIQDQGFTLFFETMQRVAGAEKNPLKRLRKLAHAYFEFALKHPEHYDLMFIIRAPMRAAESWMQGENSFEFLRATVRECIDAELLPFSDENVGAMFFWSQVHGAVSLALRDRLGMFPEKERQRVLRRSVELTLDMAEALLRARQPQPARRARSRR